MTSAGGKVTISNPGVCGGCVLLVLLAGHSMPAIGSPVGGTQLLSKPSSVSTVNTQTLRNPTPDALDLRIERNVALSLRDTIRLAVERNPRLRVAQERLLQAGAVLGFTQAARGPKLSLASSSSYSFGYQGSSILASSLDNAGTTIASSSQTFALPTVGLNLIWPVFSSALIDARIASADSGLLEANLEVARQLQQLKLEAVTAYLNLQQAQGNIEIRQLALQNAEATFKDTDTLVKAGQTTRFELVRSQVQLLRAQQQLQEARGVRVIAQRELARQLNFFEPTDVIAQDEIARSEALETPLEQAIAKALESRVELQQDRARAARARADREAALAQLAPQMQLVSSVGYGNAFNTLSQVSAVGRGPASSSSLLGYNQNTFSASLGLQMSLALTDAGAASAQAQQAEALQRIAELNLVDDTNQVRFQVEKAFVQLVAAEQQRQTGLQEVEQARLSLEYARLRYRAGIGLQLDVLNATNDLIQAKADVLRTTLSHNQADSDLRRAMGEL